MGFVNDPTNMAESSLVNKSVIITGMLSVDVGFPTMLISIGGASGIGLAVVRYFASQSSRISILDISATSAQTVVSSLRAEYPSASFLFKKCDISNWDEQKVVFEEVYKEFGSIDIVFANAGVSEIGTFLGKSEGAPSKPNLRTLEINLIGTLYCKSF